MVVTELGMVTLVKSLQFQKAQSPMAVTVNVIPLWVTVAGIATSPWYSGSVCCLVDTSTVLMPVMV